MEIIQMFSDDKSTANYYLEELNYRLDLFNEQLNKEINDGIV